MKKIFNNYKMQFKLLLVLGMGVAVIATMFYFLIPNILNYPKGTYNSNFQLELENTNYIVQVLLIAFAIFLLFTVIVFSQTKFLKKYKRIIKDCSNVSQKEINEIRNKLYNVPYTMYMLNIIVPSILITVIHAFTINQIGITTLKIFILTFSFITVYISGFLVYAKRLFKNLLLKLPNTDNTSYKKVSITYRFFLHIMPLFIVSILFIALIGYSRVIAEKGELIFSIYKERLISYTKNEEIKNIDDLKELLKNMPIYNDNDIIFIKKPDGTFIDRNGNKIEFSAYFNKYLNEMSFENDGRVYEYYGVDAQGCVQKVYINNDLYIIGAYYEINSNNLLYYFCAAFLVLMAINITVLYLFANSYSGDISTIVSSFSSMINNKNEVATKKIPVTSNDEIGDLCITFNKVQELTTEYIDKIHSSQDMLIERERLASLGQMIGGIAHNLKTPIMSIAGAAEGLNDLINEYDSSIGDDTVTNEDHHDIAKDMQVWVEKVKNYTSYMSDVITAVKGQAVTLSDDQAVNFNIGEIEKLVSILMKHELKNALVDLNIDIEVDRNLELKGNVNSLVQVINNIISNAIQSYNGEPNKKVDMSIYQEEKNIVIAIKDYGTGLPKKVQEKLFKEMITTKGKDGTGLGLFMSYSTIRAHFKGNITYETKEGEGTTFYIVLPIE